MPKHKIKKEYLPLIYISVFAVILRLVISALSAGHPYDTPTFLAWGYRMADIGPYNFYEEGYFADYPPLYMLVLGIVGIINSFIPIGLEFLQGVVLSVIPILCDVFLAFFMYFIVKKSTAHKFAFTSFLVVCFNPLLILNSSIWKQVDSVFTALLVLCFWFLSKKKMYLSAFFYIITLLVKPQTLIFGPVFALFFLIPIISAKSKKLRLCAIKTLAVSFSICATIFIAISFLFMGAGTPIVWLLEKFFTTASSYPYGSVNAFNLIALLGGNWQTQSNVAFLVSWQTLGILGIAAATIALFVLAYYAYKNRIGASLPFLLAGFYSCAVFTLGHHMHERYLIASVFCLAIAAFILDDKRILRSAICFNILCFANVATVYYAVDIDLHLTSSTSKTLVFVFSLLQVISFIYLTFSVAKICICKDKDIIEGKPKCNSLSSINPTEKKPQVSAIEEITPVPRWNKRDTIIITALTLFTLVVSTLYLGDTQMASSGVTATGKEAVAATFKDDFKLDKIFVLPSVGNGDLEILSSGESLGIVDTSWDSVYTWQEIETDLNISATSSLQITFTDGITINEIAFFDADGNLHTPAVSSDYNALFDEQSLVPTSINQMNGMYFDEIYHARTGYEMLTGMPIYETTHPPLGKAIIMMFIGIFGMSPFGWRIGGVLFGVAMVPVLYLIARRLLKNTNWAAFCATLFALDFMRFTQTRIATIDVFVVFFILLSFYFMIWAAQNMQTAGVKKSIIPIALSGAAFGLSCAAKWTGLYSGVGLCIIYFAALYRRSRRLGDGSQVGDFKADVKHFFAYGTAFFVLIPSLIYFLSYIPYFWQPEGFSIAGFFSSQESMFSYHSALVDDHPFGSLWYSWPFIVKPVWYYMGGGLADGQSASIVALGNPVLWWGGIVAILYLVIAFFRKKCPAEGKAVLIGFAAQFLPWVLVTRVVFLYHYFPSVPFITLALGMACMAIEKKNKRIGKALMFLLPSIALILFILFIPVLSGMPVSTEYITSLKWFDSWVF